MEVVTGFLFFVSTITVECDCNHEIQTLALWKESHDKHSALKAEISLANKARIVKIMVFPNVWMWEWDHKDG